MVYHAKMRVGKKLFEAAKQLSKITRNCDV
jgi:hypothetical protein